MEGDQSPQELDTPPLIAPRKLQLHWLLYPKVVLYVNGLQQYAQKFGLSLLILCLWYWFILNMSNISVVLLYSPVWTCSDIFYYWWTFGRFFGSGYCEWYHSEHSSAFLLRNMHGILGPHVAWILPKRVFQSGLYPLTHPLLRLSGALDPQQPLECLSCPS